MGCRGTPGIGHEDIPDGELDDFLVLGQHLVFRRPLVRSAVYGVASPADLVQAHDALEWVTNPALDADRRAWPWAAAGPDEEIVSGLERTADQARDHGGHAAETALTARSSEFTPDPHIGARRLVAAPGATVRGRPPPCPGHAGPSRVGAEGTG
jgi:hypothetical protein